MRKSSNSPWIRVSAAANTALLNAPAGREGAVVTAAPLVLAELSAAGLIGARHGLTRTGVIRREREAALMLDELF